MRSAALLLCIALPFSLSSFAQTELPLGSGKSTWTEGYALKTPNGGLSSQGVEQGDYWQERTDGKCDFKKVRLVDRKEFEANRVRSEPPAVTSKEEIGECPIKTYVVN